MRFLTLIAATLAAVGTADAQTTSGDCSPIVQHVAGSVTITCNIEGQIPIYKFRAFLQNDGRAQEIMGKFHEFFEKNKDRVFALDIEIDDELEEAAEGDYANRVLFVHDYRNESNPAQQLIQLTWQPMLDGYPDDGGSRYTLWGPVSMTRRIYAISGYFTAQHDEIQGGFNEYRLLRVDKQQLLLGGKHKLP